MEESRGIIQPASDIKSDELRVLLTKLHHVKKIYKFV